MRLDSYAHDETYAYDPLTEKYGFQAGFEERLTNGAGTCGEQEEALAHTFSVEPVEIQESGSKDDENKDRGVEAEEEMSEEETGEEVGEDFFIIVPSEDHEEEVPSPEDVKPKCKYSMSIEVCVNLRLWYKVLCMCLMLILLSFNYDFPLIIRHPSNDRES